ncbi:type II toxin-antitoxin system VapB family antitoxin [Devosia aurantiaca]|nr:type II toxin-antitoxin system VapB family antitoxin [Devosia aurantiaca]
MTDAILKDGMEVTMKTTVTIDNQLLKDAKEISGISDTEEVVEAALKELMHRDASRYLASLGGTMPDLEYPPRYRGMAEE